MVQRMVSSKSKYDRDLTQVLHDQPKRFCPLCQTGKIILINKRNGKIGFR